VLHEHIHLFEREVVVVVKQEVIQKYEQEVVVIVE
jgi:hypothetical protein